MRGPSRTAAPALAVRVLTDDRCHASSGLSPEARAGASPRCVDIESSRSSAGALDTHHASSAGVLAGCSTSNNDGSPSKSGRSPRNLVRAAKGYHSRPASPGAVGVQLLRHPTNAVAYPLTKTDGAGM